LGSITGYLAPAAGISVHAGAFSGAAGDDGSYRIYGLPPGAVTVAPAAANAVFVLSNQLINLGPDVAGINFHSYQSNAFAIERLSDSAVHFVFAGAVGESWRISSSSNLSEWMPYSTNAVQASGLFEFLDSNSPPSPGRFFQGQRP
jgi:hypothetical protein